MFCYENFGLFDIVSLIASLIVEPWKFVNYVYLKQN